MTTNNIVKFSPKKQNRKPPKTQAEKDRAYRIKALIIFSFLIIFFIVQRIFFYDPAELQKSDTLSYTTTNGSNIVEAHMSTGGHYIIDGKINGHEVTFVVDTGASFVSIPQSVADRIKLKKGKEITANTAGGKTESFITHLDSLSIGTIKKMNIIAQIVPAMDKDIILLGNNFLYDLNVQQVDRKLIIKQ